ncbi:hypothetical protein, partial [Salmonella enterica]
MPECALSPAGALAHFPRSMMNKTLRLLLQRRLARLPLQLALLACTLSLMRGVQAAEALMPAVEDKTPLLMPPQAAAR